MPDDRVQGYLETLPEYKKSKYSIKVCYAYTTYSLNRSAIFLPGGLRVLMNGYGVPFFMVFRAGSISRERA